MKNKFTPDPTFATSPICITDPEFDFSIDLSLISTVEADPFYGRENDDAIEHLTKLTELGGLFTTDERIRNFYVTKLVGGMDQAHNPALDRNSLDRLIREGP